MAQKVVLKIMTMNDEKTKLKAIEAPADIYGVDSIAADLKEQKLAVIGDMDAVAVAKKLEENRENRNSIRLCARALQPPNS